ncbi:MAG: sugar ABC transporter permease [Betaproteobacteria bacterium]|nr:sugar ABC transporter permease [Betaproteobacteria bacterium]
MTTLSLLPAVLEVIRLLLIVAVAVAGLVGFLWANYKTWHSEYYLPGAALLALVVAAELHLVFEASLAISVVLGALPLLLAVLFKYAIRGRWMVPFLFAAPASVGVALLFLYPLVFEIYLSFHRLNLETLGDWIRTGAIDFTGFENFIEVLQVGSETKESFWIVTARTFAWTGINLVFHVFFGLVLALFLNQKIRGVGAYRTILMLPWAIPQLIAVLAWRGEFHSTFGYVNNLIRIVNDVFSFGVGEGRIAPLEWVGFRPQEWWTNPQALFASICIVNIWLGIPFMMMVSLSGLQSISKSYYEAASLDGASAWQRFRHITLPLLKPIMVPSMILGMIWTFNNVNVVYLMTAQRGGSEGADILVSDLYKQAFVYNRYSFSAAYAIVIFLILLVLTAVWMKSSRMTEDPGRN